MKRNIDLTDEYKQHLLDILGENARQQMDSFLNGDSSAKMKVYRALTLYERVKQS